MKSFAASVMEELGANLDGLNQDSINQEFRTTIAFLVDGFLEKQRSDSIPAVPFTPIACPECEARKLEKLDTSTATKRIVNWNGLKIGVTHGPDDIRFGQKLRTASYGRIYRSYGQAEDGKAVDAWVGPDVKIPEDDGEVENSAAFWMNQIDPADGSLNERKLVIGFRDRAAAKEAIQATMPAHLRDSMFGGLYDCTDNDLEGYRVQKIIQQDSSSETDLMNLLTEGEPWRQQRVDYEGDDHRYQVIEALAANLPVPPYILLDYPDLAEKLATTPPENLWQYPNAIAVLDSLDIRNDGITSMGWVHWDDCGCSQCSLKKRKKKKPINPRPLEDIEEEVQKEEVAKNGFLGDSDELRADKKCGNGHVADNKKCKSEGGKTGKDLWGVWHEGRRTSVIVDASNRNEAIAEAEKKKKRGGKGIDAARPLNDKEKKAISKGRWLRTGPDGQPAGYNKNKAGYGPKPKTDADEETGIEADEDADVDFLTEVKALPSPSGHDEEGLDHELEELPKLDSDEPEKDSVDYFLEGLDKASPIASWLTSIKSWLKKQPDLETVSSSLGGALFPVLKPEGFATGLEDGMLLVDLLGRSEVMDEGEEFDSERTDAPRPDWLKMSFKEAIAYFKAKVPIPVASYKKMADNYHDVAFSVTNLTKAELLEDVKWLVERAIADGDSLEVFNRRWDRLITRKGWKVGGNRRKLIYDTNIRSAYSRGREQQMRDPDVLSRRPFWIIRGGDSVTPRPHHAVLNDKAIAASHSFWKVAGSPIWGFSCKHKIFAASEDYLKRNEIEILENPPDPKTVAEPGFRKGLLAKGPERDKILGDAIAKLDPELQKLVKESVDPTE